MEKTNSSKKILLILLPFWDPQIPPLGIACMKSYLTRCGYTVKGIDANLEVRFRSIHDNYFNLMGKHVPENRRGNIYNIGNQVLRNHLVAHINYDNEAKYKELLKILAAKTFFCDFPDDVVQQLDDLIRHFYKDIFNSLRIFTSYISHTIRTVQTHYIKQSE